MRLWYAVILFSFLIGSQALASNEVVVIRGAASMLRLSQDLIEMYQAEHPGDQVQANVADSFESLPEGPGSIWQGVHRLDAAQKRQLQQRFGDPAHEIAIAIEGTVVIVNKANPATDLTLEQLRAIYAGKTTNWKDVGGKESAIHLYSTESMVGGSLFFTDLLMRGEEIDTTMRAFVNPKETESAIEQDPQGIGLIPLPAGNRVKYPRMRRAADAPAVEASSENIRMLHYPLSSYVYWAFPEQHTQAITQLVRFTLSARGQLAVEAAGYYPLAPADRLRATMELDRTHNSAAIVDVSGPRR